MKRKFGMFLHFGINTFENVQWSDGTVPAERYCPSQIDADQWVRTACEAGMKFVLLVSKHHDGFCMWDPHPCRKGDPKIYTFEGKRYYLPFEMTICIRGRQWFYSDNYEKYPFMDVEAVAADCQTAFDERNIAVINMPPNKEGRLVEDDIAYLMKVVEKLKRGC